MYPNEIMDKKSSISRIDMASESTLSALSPEIREGILNDEEWNGDIWKSDAYSLGIKLAIFLILARVDFIRNNGFQKIRLAKWSNLHYARKTW